MGYTRHPNTICLICNKPIYKRPFEIFRKSGNVFCSIQCYGKSNRKESPCVVCGTPIMSGLNKKTCSRVCANKHRAGIKYKLNRPRDKVSGQRALKIRLLQVRGTVCEKCGYGKTEILQVHHRDKNRGNNNLVNLELVCPNCHYEEHFLEKSWLREYNLNPTEG